MKINHITQVPDGTLFDANHDPRILELREKAKSICYDYNATRPGSQKMRTSMIEQLLKGCGANPTIEPPFVCDYGKNISIGNDFYSNHNLIILDTSEVTIGDNVFIAPNVSIYTAGHPLDVKRRNQGLEYGKPVSIGNNVWIGGGVTITPGVTIGDNCIIGAGSIVTKDIPPNMLAVGNPCRVLRAISQDDADREFF